MRLVSGMISLACSINFFPVLVLARLMNLLHLHSADFLTVFQFLQSVRRNINCMKQTMVLINNRSLHCFLLLQRIRTFTGSVTLLSSYSFNFLSSKSSPQWRRTLRGELVCLLTYTSCEDWDFVSPVASVSNFCSRQHLCFFSCILRICSFPDKRKQLARSPRSPRSPARWSHCSGLLSKRCKTATSNACWLFGTDQHCSSPDLISRHNIWPSLRCTARNRLVCMIHQYKILDWERTAQP